MKTNLWEKSDQELSAASSPELVALTRASSRPGGDPFGRLKSTPQTGLHLLTDFPAPGNSRMSAASADGTLNPSIASPSAVLAPISATWAALAQSVAPDSAGKPADFFLKPYVSSAKYSLGGSCSKMSRHCSIATVAATLSGSSRSLPNSGSWDITGCSMLNSSESPRIVAGSSWSAVLDECPTPTSWLMPVQWSQYLARLMRAKSGPEMAGLAIFSRQRTMGAASTYLRSFLSLRRTDGVRWLSGPERLRYMGFTGDWMRSALLRRSLRGTLYAPRSRGGLLKF